MQYVEYAGKCDKADTKPGRFNPKNVNLDEMAFSVNISRLTLDTYANWKSKVGCYVTRRLMQHGAAKTPPPRRKTLPPLQATHKHCKAVSNPFSPGWQIFNFDIYMTLVVFDCGTCFKNACLVFWPDIRIQRAAHVILIRSISLEKSGSVFKKHTPRKTAIYARHYLRINMT